MWTRCRVLGSGHTRYESKALYLNITISSIRCHFGAVRSLRWTRGIRAYLEKGVGLPIIDDVLWVDHLPVNKPSFLGVAAIRGISDGGGRTDRLRCGDLWISCTIPKRIKYYICGRGTGTSSIRS